MPFDIISISNFSFPIEKTEVIKFSLLFIHLKCSKIKILIKFT